MLEREAELLETLHEAKLATFSDHGWDGDLPYLVLEYLIGTDLHRYAQIKPLDLEELKPIVSDIITGLRALHRVGIVHRDLKPGNVFLRLQLPTDAGEKFLPAHRDPAVVRISEAVVIDFGISRTIGDAQIIDSPEGTLGFLAPEQAEASDAITAQADIYSLAATVYSALTQKTLFAARPNPTACLIAHAFERPFADPAHRAAIAHLPVAVLELLDAATSITPTDRPTVDEFASAFAAL